MGFLVRVFVIVFILIFVIFLSPLGNREDFACMGNIDRVVYSSPKACASIARGSQKNVYGSQRRLLQHWKRCEEKEDPAVDVDPTIRGDVDECGRSVSCPRPFCADSPFPEFCRNPSLVSKVMESQRPTYKMSDDFILRDETDGENYARIEERLPEKKYDASVVADDGKTFLPERRAVLYGKSRALLTAGTYVIIDSGNKINHVYSSTDLTRLRKLSCIPFESHVKVCNRDVKRFTPSSVAAGGTCPVASVMMSLEDIIPDDPPGQSDRAKSCKRLKLKSQDEPPFRDRLRSLNSGRFYNENLIF
jgi:hypothetical protein